MRWLQYSLHEFIPQKSSLLMSFFLSLGIVGWACPFYPVYRLYFTSQLLSLPLFTWSPAHLDLPSLNVNIYCLRGSTGTELDDFSTSFPPHTIFYCWTQQFTIAAQLDIIRCSLLFSSHDSGLHRRTNMESSTVSRHTLFTNCFPWFCKKHLCVFFFIRTPWHYIQIFQ